MPITQSQREFIWELVFFGLAFVEVELLQLHRQWTGPIVLVLLLVSLDIALFRCRLLGKKITRQSAREWLRAWMA